MEFVRLVKSDLPAAKKRPCFSVVYFDFALVDADEFPKIVTLSRKRKRTSVFEIMNRYDRIDRNQFLRIKRRIVCGVVGIHDSIIHRFSENNKFYTVLCKYNGKFT